MATAPAYYNEIDPFAADWLRNLMAEGHIPAGDVDTRSIKDVQPDDLDGYRHCHFFAGIGGWALALRLAGWPDDVPIWTGSCPCQPFSDAGRKRGTDDPRHLWPDFCRLIRARNPATTVGEQVASKDGLEWLAGVRADMEASGREFGAADLCAPWVAAPHLRQRLYWLAISGGAECRWWAQPRWQHWRALHVADRCGNGGMANTRCERVRGGRPAEDDRSPGAGEIEGEERERLRFDAGHGGDSGRLSDSELQRTRARESGVEGSTGSRRHRPAIDGDAHGVVDGQQPRLEGHGGDGDDGSQPGWIITDPDGSIAEAGAWSAFRAVSCRDNRSRRVPLPESGVLPLAYGIPRNVGSLLAGVASVGPDAKLARRNRVGRLKGYGNAIVPHVAAEFIRAYMECG